MLLVDLSFLAPLSAILFGLSLAAFALWANQKKEKAHSASMQALADVLGCSFSEQDSQGLAKQLQGFDLFEREGSRWHSKGRVRNVLRGKVGDTDVYLFEYSYMVNTGKSQHRVTQTVFFADDKKWFLPDFRLKPERWWHKLQAKMGLESDINFPGNPDFSEKFWLKSEFEGLVRQQFTPALQGFFAERPPSHLEGNNYYLIAYKPRKRLDADEARVFFQHCCEVVGMLRQEGKMELLNLAELKVKVEASS